MIKDALTKAILMRQQQLWLQSLNNSLEKSAYRGSHYHPTCKGTQGQAARRGLCRQSTETAKSQHYFHRKAIEEFWLPGQKAASSSWGKPWSLTDCSSSAMCEDAPCKRPSPMQPCIQSNQWHTRHGGQRKQTPGPLPKRPGHVQEENGRRSHL